MATPELNGRMHVCRVCGNGAGNSDFPAVEMMFGSREEFAYFLCAVCGCLQIAEVPADMGRHYPRDYYSFSPPPANGLLAPLKFFIKKRRLKSVLGERSSLGGWCAAKFPPPGRITTWFRRAGMDSHTPILEVGCGNGTLLMELNGEGFENLTGIDPFVDADILYPNGVRVLKRTLEDMTGTFGFAMMHHAFEHLPDPLSSLRMLGRLLKPGAEVLLRIPVAAAAWKEYGRDWVQLDAPRHFYLHTEKSMRLLAGRAGFKVTDVIYDSTAFQFWGSEQYRMGIPLRDSRSFAVSPADSPFTHEMIHAFEGRAQEWNRTGQGDQACFFLQADR